MRSNYPQGVPVSLPLAQAAVVDLSSAAQHCISAFAQAGQLAGSFTAMGSLPMPSLSHKLLLQLQP